VSATSPAAGSTAEASLAVVARRFWWPVYGAWRDLGDPPVLASARTGQVFERLVRGSPFLRHEDHNGRLRLLLQAEWESVRVQAAAGPPPSPLPAWEGVDLEAAEARDDYGGGSFPVRRFRDRWAVTVLEQAMEILRLRARHAGTEAQFERLRPYLAREVPDWHQTDIGVSVDSVEVDNLRDAFRTAVRRVVGATVTTPMILEAELVELFG